MQIESYIRLGLTVIVVVVLLWILFRFRAKKSAQKNSLDILKERLHQGEITEKEYEQARNKQIRDK